MKKGLRMRIRERKKGFSVECFDSIAVRNNVLKKGIDFLFAIRFSKFRIDFEKGEVDHSVSTQILKKIVLRGHVTRLSEDLEKKVIKLAKGRKFIYRNKVVLDQYFDGEKRENLGGQCAEEYVYKNILIPEVLKYGAGNERDVLVQVEFDSLIDDGEGKGRRVDFLITNGFEKLVVEVDDETHEGHDKKDTERDRILKRNCIKTVRLSTKNLKNTESADQVELRSEIARLYKKIVQKEQIESVENISILLAHRFQTILISLVENGIFDKKKTVYVADDCLMGLDRVFADEIFEESLRDLQELAKSVGKIYGEKNILTQVRYKKDNYGALITRNFSYDHKGAQILFSELNFPNQLINFQEHIQSEIYVKDFRKSDLEFVFRYIFRHDEFKENQFEAISRILKGENAVLLSPTGSGKSAVYQFLGLFFPGVTVVVEPLKALIDDQIQNLKLCGVDIALGLFSDLKIADRNDIGEQICAGGTGLLYLTPERLKMASFSEVVEKAQRSGVRFSICALDEVHCVSEWGHDFRVSYLDIVETCRNLFRITGKELKILGLTGTASENVLSDAQRELGLDSDGVIRPNSFDRPEIHYRVIKSESKEKSKNLLNCLNVEITKDLGKNFNDGPGIVFCTYKTDKTDFGVNAVFGLLNRNGVEGVTRYYATDTDSEMMQKNAKDFKTGKSKIMVATKAYGMGIDKSDIRYTIHFGIPDSIETFYQEAGRSGRDGAKAMSYILLSNDFPEENELLIGADNIKNVRSQLSRRRKDERDDIGRLLFLHQRNYDQSKIINNLRIILSEIGSIRDKNVIIVARTSEEFDEWQKVLYRLKWLDVISGYSIQSYANKEIDVGIKEFDARRIVLAYGRYVSRYHKGIVDFELEKLRQMKFTGRMDFLLSMMRVFVDFENEIFEKSRRRSLGNMLRLAEEVAMLPEDKQDSAMRMGILDYLGNSFKDCLGKVLSGRNGGVFEPAKIVSELGGDAVNKLLSEGRQKLQTYPDHPGLLVLVGFLGSIDKKTGAAVAVNDIVRGVNSATEKYGAKWGEIKKSFEYIIFETSRKCKDEEKFVIFMDLLIRNFEGDEEEFFNVLPTEFKTKIVLKRMEEAQNLVLNNIRRIDLWKK